MIIQCLIPSPESTELNDDILDNNLLVYVVWDHGDNGIHVSSQLTTLRKMMERLGESETVAEVVTKWCRSEGWVDPDVDNCLVEVVFDQETAEARAGCLCDMGNRHKGRCHVFAQFGSVIIDHFSDRLPEKVDYAV